MSKSFLMVGLAAVAFATATLNVAEAHVVLDKNRRVHWVPDPPRHRPPSGTYNKLGHIPSTPAMGRTVLNSGTYNKLGHILSTPAMGRTVLNSTISGRLSTPPM